MSTPSNTRVTFLGTPDFSVPCLEGLIQEGYQVVACYCQPPKPIGRGHRVQKMPVHQVADSHTIPVFTPTSLKSQEEQDRFKSLNLDLAVVIAYGLILPKAILESPAHGCVNVHASLLPRWRGAAPLQRALLAGDSKTGVSIMQMDEGLDTGPVILKKELPIPSDMTAPELHDQMAKLGREALIEALPGYLEGTLKPTPQPEDGVTYAQKLSKEEGLLDWTQPADTLLRKVRALNPWPGVWFEHGEQRIKVLHAEKREGTGTPGEVIDQTLTIACGRDALRLTRVQKAGKAPMGAETFLRGYALPQGTRL